MTKIQQLKKIAKQYGVSRIAAVVLDDPKFATWAGGTENKHHARHGGLLDHTYEVVMLCENNRHFFSGQLVVLRRDILFLAALFHDIGKTYDYELTSRHLNHVGLFPPLPEWIKTKHAREIHHISRSAIIWCKAVEQTGQCKDIEDAVLHCILSHHGQREWGSPVAPHTREAWMLHLCDGMSARMDDANKVDMLKLDKRD